MFPSTALLTSCIGFNWLASAEVNTKIYLNAPHDYSAYGKNLCHNLAKPIQYILKQLMLPESFA
jgi:hypothetical protein